VTAYAIDPWAALGDPTRRTIFERVVASPRSVGELAKGLPISRPAVSQHLKVLKQAGLVVVQRAGNRSIYEVDREGLAALRTELDRYWTDTLAGYALAVEQRQQESP
jgi:DNA-binding transcriptional ArsR family regulator